MSHPSFFAAQGSTRSFILLKVCLSCSAVHTRYFKPPYSFRGRPSSAPPRQTLFIYIIRTANLHT